MLSCNRISAITGLQAQVLFRVVFTRKQQGLLICVGGEFELPTCLRWQKYSFLGILSFCFLFPPLPHALNAFADILPSILSPKTHCTAAPCKQPGAFEALAQPAHLPLGHPPSNRPLHPLPIAPLLPPFTPSPPPHLCQAVYLLFCCSVITHFCFKPLCKQTFPLQGAASQAEYIFTSHETILKALPLSSPNQSPTKSQLYILHKHTTSTPSPPPGRQAASTRHNNARK